MRTGGEFVVLCLRAGECQQLYFMCMSLTSRLESAVNDTYVYKTSALLSFWAPREPAPLCVDHLVDTEHGAMSNVLSVDACVSEHASKYTGRFM